MDINQIKQPFSQVHLPVKGEPIPPEPPKQTPTEPFMREYSVEELLDLSKAANATIPNDRVRFRVDEQGQPPIIVIVDPDTDEIIKEIPPEEIQKVKKMLDALANGENPVTNFINEYI